MIFILMFVFFTIQAEDTSRFSYQTTDKLATYISSSNFVQSGDASLLRTYSISTPGTYILTENISSNSQTGASCAIYINSNNVSLDLGGHVLSLSNSSTNISGILINDSKYNICIKNGFISNFTGYGILLQTGSYDITIENLNVNGCILAGVGLIGSVGSPSYNVVLNECRFCDNVGNSSNDAVGLKLSYCHCVEATNCIFNHNYNSNDTYDAYGVYASNSHSNIFTNCYASKNSGETVGSGFHLETCNGWRFDKCYAYENSATDSTASIANGFYTNSSQYCTFYQCVANGQTCPINSSGFRFDASAVHYLESCHGSRQSATGNSSSALASGFRLNDTSTVGIHLKSCVAQGNKATANTSGIGNGYYSKSIFPYMQGCTAQGNGALSPGTGIGFELESGSQGAIIEACTSHQNSSYASGGGSALHLVNNGSNTVSTFSNAGNNFTYGSA